MPCAAGMVRARGDVYGRVPEQPSGAGGKTGIKNERIKTERTIQRYIINDKTSNELDQNAPLLSGRTLYAGVSVRIFSAGAA